MLPRAFQSVLREGLDAQAQGRFADAAARFARVRAGAPEAHEGWMHGGLVALVTGAAAEAVQLLSRAQALQPQDKEIAMSLAIAHLANSNLAAAEAVLRELAAKHPKLPDVWRYLGLVYETAGQQEYARMARQNLVGLAPKSAAAWLDYGSTLSLLGKQTEALTCFSRALALEPANTRARAGYAMVYLRCHRVVEAVTELQRVIARDPKDFLARSFCLMALNNLAGMTREQLFLEHVAAGCALGNPAETRWRNRPDPERRLRVGFLSRDFCDHSVAYFVEPLLQHLDRSGFEVVLYHDNARSDAFTHRFQGLADVWRPIVSQTDHTVEATIRGDALDILVDLAGHTASNRLPMLARRVAPVQITYVGYPNTTGVRAIDYRFVDECTDPSGEADAFATEKLVRFAPCAWTYSPPAVAPAVAVAPCTTDAGITFGSFNNFAKVTDEMLHTWAQILARVPGSRLLLKASGLAEAAVSEPLRRRLRAAGVADDRVELLSHTPDTASHLALYARMDIALDTAPYNGTTTTCEALWMGVPVVTLCGDRHAARVGASLLTAVGRPEWIAASTEQYVELAVELAKDPVRLAALRASIRTTVSRSALLDHTAQAQRFGAALRECWSHWCERERRMQAATASAELISS